MGAHSSLNSVQRRYWELIAQGGPPSIAGPAVGVSETCGLQWFRQRGGVKPQLSEPQGQTRRRLTPLERDEIMIGAAHGEAERSIARRPGRAPTTVMRELDKNGRCRGGAGRYRALHRFGANRGGWDAKSGYRASVAQARSEERARRPKPGKLARNPELRELVEELLLKKYSPNRSLVCSNTVSARGAGPPLVHQPARACRLAGHRRFGRSTGH